MLYLFCTRCYSSARPAHLQQFSQMNCYSIGANRRSTDCIMRTARFLERTFSSCISSDTSNVFRASWRICSTELFL